MCWTCCQKHEYQQICHWIHGGAFRRPSNVQEISEKLNYLTMTRPYIDKCYESVYIISTYESFGYSDQEISDQDITISEKLPSKRTSIFKLQSELYSQSLICRLDSFPVYYRIVFLLVRILGQKSKKQIIVSRSNTESESKAIADIISEPVQIQNIQTEISFMPKIPMRLYRNNRSAIYIIQNYVFHERMKRIEVDCLVEESMIAPCTKLCILREDKAY